MREPAVPSRHNSRSSVGAVLAGIAVLAVAVPAAPVSAQGLFDFLFGGPRRSPPPSAHAYADPNAGGSRSEGEPRAYGPSVSYCVRLCDGRFFPIQRSSANPAQICSSFCPAARTKVFSGSAIDYAVAHDGTRYANLDTAFVYRERVVAGCTCNGKDAYGLVSTAASEDPTLRPGDIVATDTGFVAYSGSGGRGRNAQFTPIESYSGLGSDVRQRLVGTKITPRNATTVPQQIAPAAGAADRRVQLDR